MEQPIIAPLGAGVIRQVQFSQSWDRIKTSLNWSILSISITQIIILGAVTSEYYYFWFWIGPTTGVSVIWAVTELISQCVTSKKPAPRGYRGLHPGAHVGMHLLVSIGQGTCAGLSIALSVSDATYCDRYYSSGSYCRYSKTAIAPGVLALLLFTFHFTLFVRACVETHRLNNAPLVLASAAPVPAAPTLQPGFVQVEMAPMPMPTVSVPAAARYGQPGTTMSVYMVTGPDGQPQFIVPAGMQMVTMPQQQQQQPGGAVTTTTTVPVYEMSVNDRTRLDQIGPAGKA